MHSQISDACYTPGCTIGKLSLFIRERNTECIIVMFVKQLLKSKIRDLQHIANHSKT